ncbi:MAG TPA: ester cyclase [Gammaproteobacteria bacterium]|nr:ester cyclase [Gammaproteobacteria bacterium]
MNRALWIVAVFAALAASQPRVRADEPGASAALAKAKLEEANRHVVVTMYNLLMNEHKVDEALQYIDPRYKQHNLRAPDGKEFIRTAFKARFVEYPKFRSDIKRTVADGDLVVVHTHERYNPDDPSDLGNIIMDIYRVENGLIVEHWDAYMPVPPKEQWQHANGAF